MADAPATAPPSTDARPFDIIQTDTWRQHGIRTAAQLRRLRQLSGSDARTTLRWLAGLPVYRSSAERLAAALQSMEETDGKLD